MPYSTLDYHELKGWRRGYARIAPALVVFCLCASIFASLGTFAVSQAQEADRAAREAENRTLLDCFDQYATASSSSSKAVRAASVQVDAARVTHDLALNAEGEAFEVLVRHLLTQTVTPAHVRRLLTTLEARSRTGAELAATQRNLDRVRRANPVPDPPSKFCELP